MKYLIDLFVPYGSLFETNILSTSTSSIVNTFLLFQKSLFLALLPKLMFFPLILILGEKKVKFFYRNLGV